MMAMQEERIFGYSWAEIQAMQQGTYQRPTLTDECVKPTATEKDIAMLAELGEDGLRAQHFLGVLDRLRTSGLLPSQQINQGKEEITVSQPADALREAISQEFGEMASKIKVVGPKQPVKKDAQPVKTVEEVVAALDLETMIRMAIEKEMASTVAANAAKIAHYQAKVRELEGNIAGWEKQLETIRDQIARAKVDLKDAKQAMKTLEGDQEVIDQRVAMALAAARGEKPASVKPAKKSAGVSESGATAWEVTIDGTERSFKDITKLTYWLSQHGAKIGAAEFRNKFSAANQGIILLGQNHKDAGTRYVTVNGFKIGITAK